ncbi:MAG TPA: hypothetical protein VIL37_07010 [Natronosporangium sp.]
MTLVRERRAPDRFRPDLVPTWAKVAAWTVLASVLPSVTWRLTMSINALLNGDNPCMPPDLPIGEQIYIVAVLPTFQIGLASLTFGLIQRWGEVLPRWLPVVGGRRVPISFGVAAAVGGALAITALIVWSQLLQGGQPTRPLPEGCSKPGWDVLRWYLPMLLWPPLLILLAGHYRHRRRREER